MPGRTLTAALLAAATLALTAPTASANYNRWSPAASMATERYRATGVVLPDGRALMVGGQVRLGPALASAELYDPRTDAWTSATAPARARSGAAAVVLPGGRVLVAGNGTSEIYDPATDTWSAPVTMRASRTDHRAVVLGDGSVLAVGGTTSKLNSAEVWDPTTGKWTATPQMAHPRVEPAVALLRDGRVLVAGGRDLMDEAGAEIYDPRTPRWEATGAMGEARTGAGAAVLPNGQVLVAGGRRGPDSAPLASATSETFDPATGAWTRAGDMGTKRGIGLAMTALADGRPVATGGVSWTDLKVDGLYEPTTEVFDPAARTWTPMAPLAFGRAGHVALTLADGSLFVVGGYGVCREIAERFVPAPPPPPVTPVLPSPGVIEPPRKDEGTTQSHAKPGKLTFIRPFPKRLKSRNVAVRVKCSGGPCSDTLALRRGKQVLASRAFTAKDGQTLTLRLKLSRRPAKRATPVTLVLTRHRQSLSASLRR